MLEPYSDKPEESGIMRTPEDAWMPLIDDFVRNVRASELWIGTGLIES